MKIFLDTADYKKVATCAQTGLVDGVTINPTTLKAQHESPSKIVSEMLKILPEGEINLQVTQEDPHKVYEQAQEIAAFSENMLVKIPCHEKYLPVINQLLQDGIRVNVTLVFSVSQALLMAKLGVDYISVFVGRLFDNNVNGIEVAGAVQDMLDTYGFESELLVASVRSKEQVEQSVAFGADAITMPVEVFTQLIQHPLSDAGLAKFHNDWVTGQYKQLLE